MGAWSHKSFGNDDALDWVYELESSEGDEIISSTLNLIIEVPENLHDGTICSCAVAAAEIIAAAKGNASSDLPDEVRNWLTHNHLPYADSLSEKATDAITLIRNSSELKSLWEDSDNYDDWLDDMSDLIKRLA